MLLGPQVLLPGLLPPCPQGCPQVVRSLWELGLGLGLGGVSCPLNPAAPTALHWHPKFPGLGKAVAGSLLAKGWAEQLGVALVRVFLWGWGPRRCLLRVSPAQVHCHGYSRHLHYRHSITPRGQADHDLSCRMGVLQCLRSASAVQV